MITRDQARAARIFKQVEALPQDKLKEYNAMADKLSILIRTAGLAQALEFVDARGNEVQHKLLDDLSKEVIDAPGAQFAEYSRNAPLDQYIWLTRETMAALLWYKRFAQSVPYAARVEEGDSHDATS